MAVSRRERKHAVKVMVLAESASERLDIMNRLLQVEGMDCTINLVENSKRGLGLLRTKDYDLVFLDKPSFKQLEGRDMGSNEGPISNPSSFVVIHQDPDPVHDTFFQADVEAYISPERIDVGFITNLLARKHSKSNDTTSRGENDLKLCTRSCLKDYLNTIVNRYKDTAFECLLILLKVSRKLRGSAVLTPATMKFFKSISRSVREQNVVDKRLGEYDSGVLWELLIGVSLPADLKRSMLRLLREIRDDLRESKPTIKPTCNAVVLRFQPARIKTKELTKEVNHSLR